jgi:peptidoglycan/LPS O-acetylase OafA/YrhL
MNDTSLTKSKIKREITFDILKIIGLVGIFIAHTVKGQPLLLQLRNFDVPLMILVSGSLFYTTSQNKQYSWVSYLKKRVPRLLAPVWLFLLLFFIKVYLLSVIEGKKYPFSLKEIIDSFFLTDGIGYVWIIRVFLLIAIVSPLLLKLRQHLGSDRRFLGMIAIIYIGYEILFFLIEDLTTPEFSNPSLDFWIRKIFFISYNTLIEKWVLFLIPYSCVFAVGMIITNLKNKTLIYFTIFFSIIFSLLAIFYYNQSGAFIETQKYKYPPQLYYLSYSLAISLFLYLLVKFLTNTQNNLQNNNLFVKIIIFISSSSLWIYLWHIAFLSYGRNILQLLPFNTQFIPRFWVIFMLSVIATYIHKQLITLIIQKTQIGQKYSQTLTILFLQ